MKYSLLIQRYGRYMTFDSVEELRDEVRSYFTKKEQASGIVERLTTFNRFTNGMAENKYQNMTVSAFGDF